MKFRSVIAAARRVRQRPAPVCYRVLPAMRVPARPRVSAAAVTGWWYIALFMAPAADARRHGNRPFTHSRRRPLHAPAAQIPRHAPGRALSADEHMHARRGLREVRRCLPSRVTGTHDDHLIAAAELCLDERGNGRADPALPSRGRGPLPSAGPVVRVDRGDVACTALPLLGGMCLAARTLSHSPVGQEATNIHDGASPMKDQTSESESSQSLAAA